MKFQSFIISLETESTNEHHCMFEWVYFAQPVSEIDSKLVFDVRMELGRRLAKQIKDTPFEWDMVTPIPDTSRIAAQAIAQELKIPFVEAIIKNRYMHRTFIMQSPGIRSAFAEQKYLYIRSKIENKRILIIDDSIVRGLTSKLIVKHLFTLGAQQIGFAIACPPIRFPCYYGVDFSTTNELIAHNRSIDEIEQWLGATKLYYITLEDLKESINLPLCDACISGDYPTTYGKKLHLLVSEGALTDNSRHYEQLILTNHKDKIILSGD